MLFKSSAEKISAKLKSISIQGGTISGIVERDGKVYVTVEANDISSEQASLAKKQIEEKLEGHSGIKSVNVIFTGTKKPEEGVGGGAQATTSDQRERSLRGARAAEPLSANNKTKPANWNHDLVPGIKKIIAVASGKGGVGKSTVTASLAAALSASGKKVGIMDADIYGPSMPRMLGLSGKPETENGKIIPLENNGIKCMSMGFLVAGDQPVVWRGPMLTKTINQFVRSVEWGELDFLLVDMPPGTGDIHISMIQQVPLSGVIIVSTPQEVALDDARRCLAMFKQLGVPALGMVENMSYFTDPQSGNRTYIFGEGGAEKLAKEMGIPFLGAVPLEPVLREKADKGELYYPQAISEVAASLCKSL